LLFLTFLINFFVASLLILVEAKNKKSKLNIDMNIDISLL